MVVGIPGDHLNNKKIPTPRLVTSRNFRDAPINGNMEESYLDLIDQHLLRVKGMTGPQEVLARWQPEIRRKPTWDGAKTLGK